MDKKSFVLYNDQSELVSKLTDTQAGKLFKAIYSYEISGSFSKLDAITEMVMVAIRQNLDRNKEQYERIKQSRINAGREGGKQKAKNLASVANASFDKKNVAKLATSSKASSNVNVNVNDNVNINNKEKIYKKEKYSDDFEVFWGWYPKRQGNQNKIGAFRVWCTQIKTYDPECLIAAAKQYQLHCKTFEKIDTEFVMMAQTFLGRDKPFLQKWEINHEKTKANKSVSAYVRECADIANDRA